MDAQVVLVTGCSQPKGFGFLTCMELARRGHTPYASMRDPEGRSSEHAATLREAGVPVLALDVTDDAQVTAAVARVTDAEGRLDALVNNGALITAGALEETTPERLLAVLDANVVGPHRLIRAVLPSMRAAGTGTIVQVSSVNGFYTEPMMGTYSSSKHALNAYSDALTVEVGPFGVRVVVIEPGSFSTGAHGRIDWEPGSLEPDSAFAEMLAATWGEDPTDETDVPFVDPIEVVTAIVDAIEHPPEPGLPTHVVLGQDGDDIDARMGHSSAIATWLQIVHEEFELGDLPGAGS